MYKGKKMSEEKETSKLKNIAKFCFKNFINVVLALLTTYYFLLAFVLENSFPIQIIFTYPYWVQSLFFLQANSATGRFRL